MGNNTSLLSEENGAMGGVPAGVEEGRQTGEKLFFSATCVKTKR